MAPTNTKKRFFKKKNPMTKKAVKKTFAKRVKTIIRKDLETKYLDASANGVQISTVGSITDLTALITKGLNVDNRVGEQITPIRCDVRYQLLQASTTPTTCIVRIIFFVWKSDSITAPTLGQILGNGLAAAPDIHSSYNYNNRLSYKILSDRTYNIFVGTDKGQHVGHFSFRNMPIMTYTTNATTGENHLYSMAISNLGTSAATNPFIYQTIKLFYKDG